MAQIGSIGVDVREVVRDRLTLSLKMEGLRAFALRVRVAAIILRVAGWVSPVPIVVEIVEHEART